ncbi:hypothetical protein ACEWY4_017193 [Coilia grayii]|uniref:H15 domain-containing protein n=1 Tax=Coilia grayii TaxID=363190 RepID=A0ABD1JG51_9TELE
MNGRHSTCNRPYEDFKKGGTAPSLQKARPCFGKLVVALTESKGKGGVSLAALKSALCADGYKVERNNSRVKLADKSLVSKGTLLQTKSTGASGYFKPNKQQVEAKKKPAKKPAAKEPSTAKKPKKAAAKKPAAAKKSPKKATKSSKLPKTPPKDAKRKDKKPRATKPKHAAPGKRR